MICSKTVSAQTIDTTIYNGLVLGMGWGTFLILILVIIGGILIFLRKLLVLDWIIVVIAILVPIIAFIILYFWPKESVSSTTTTTTVSYSDPTDFYQLKIGFCFGFGALVFILSLGCYAYTTLFQFVYSRRVDTVRLEKFRRNKDIDSDDEEDEAFEMNKYDLEEEEEEDEGEQDEDVEESNQREIDDNYEERRLINN